MSVGTEREIERLAAGWWRAGEDGRFAFREADLQPFVQEPRTTVHLVVGGDGSVGLATGGGVTGAQAPGALRWLGALPPLYPEWLGDRAFTEAHGLRFPYVAGEMARGIATPAMVIAAARAGMLGFLGTGGLSPARVEAMLAETDSALSRDGLPWGANLLHTPSDPAWEETVTDLYLRHGVERVSASAFMALTPSVVRYAARGLGEHNGQVVRRHRLFAKVSRPEVARMFLSPAPGAILSDLVAKGQLTESEANLALRVPVAEDLTVEADSGGHTDNRPLVALMPVIRALADREAARFGYERAVRVGAGGGLGTPGAVAAAFQLGAAYAVVGSVHQMALESGLSPAGRELLAQAGIADFGMAPAADMFELGVKVQVLTRGTLFRQRAELLYRLYESADSLEAIAPSVRERLERELFRAPLESVWQETRLYMQERAPKEVERAAQDPRHRMALVFRSYLGRSSQWAVVGDPDRVRDYQIWAGPAIAAFNDWVRGSFLEDPAQRGLVQIALNLLEGAAVASRAQALRSHGVAVPASAAWFRPRPLR